MTTKLFVGGLPWAVTDQDLQDHFAAAGAVETARVVTEMGYNGQPRSRGFGFVEMASEEEAQKAIEMFHESDMDGRSLTVNIAQDNGRGGNGAPREKKMFQGEWPCAECDTVITELPFMPRNPNDVLCRDCFKK